MDTQRSDKTGRLVRLAILTAILLFLTFTSFGYLKIGILEITLMHLPVIVGAVVMGPGSGAFLGLVFGLSSFAQCFMGSLLGTFLVQISPLRTFVVCVVPRLLMGYLVGLIFLAIRRAGWTKTAYVVASLCGALLNTLFFMSALFLLFGSNAGFLSFLGAEEVTLGLIGSMIGLNGVLEAAICIPFGFAVERIMRAVNRGSSNSEAL